MSRNVAAGVCLMLSLALPAHANDSMAAVAIGGLTLTKSDAIRMDSEDLYVSEKQVRVRYRFTNTSAQDIETIVAFPLPDHTASPVTPVPNFDDLKFRTLIDGQPADLSFVQQAIFKGQDVTARVTRARLPVMPHADPWEEAMKALPKPELEALVKDGLLHNIGDEKNPDWENRWVTRTIVTRKQIFPAGKTVAVEHSYAPIVGGSVGGAFNREYRKEEGFAERKRTYCVDDGFVKSFDTRQAKAKEKSNYAETWLSYVLKTGANWHGPIGDFRMVVDKGDADALVSFCAKGVKKIGPTQFEVRARNFVPKEDLNVLIVKFNIN